MKEVLIVHDYFIQNGGAERVAIAISKIYPESKIVTLSVSKSFLFEDLPKDRIIELAPWIGRLNIKFRPFLIVVAFIAFVSIRVDDKITICSTSGFSHLIRSKNKVVYCHSPARWLYEPERFLNNILLSRFLKILLTPIRFIDKTRVKKSAVICANSKNTQKRIQKFWKLESELFYPPIAFDKNDVKVMPNQFQFESKKFFLNVSRPRSYKNVDTILEAISSLDDVNLVLIGKHKFKLHPRVKSYERVSDQELCWLYANASALIAISFEDFGLTPVEAHTFGTPTIVLSQGGYLETCTDKLNSTFIDVVSEESIRSAIMDFREKEWNSDDISRTSSQFSEETFMRNLSIRILQIQKKESNE